MYTITLSNELVNHDLREVIFSSKKLVARDVITLPTVIPLYFWELKIANTLRIIFFREQIMFVSEVCGGPCKLLGGQNLWMA